ncbi:uncharacterized protein Z520_02884 [Fonsecaea multimorphosa CBS 102226]|uniref:Zn(2)-C6 fungal-type domain-containing protein n=1 Tax=Fonsecaea multimorphosa CBS 102226 TaxID=1442371 RepID=A0A0D2IWE1_9EURO|nr:uncharacterized protein Z520_02884 [Fonsecaea multimorphosa CBS 102226]KIY01332.1 hypothetical protein Z520_02884 [Fonsecaea multimorphosa CBS 102226]OAL28609.1 hypothetical protein AYO22_02803 [Fonsecaea multimorphosa]
MNQVGISRAKRKACVRCAKAKAKCSFNGGLDVCDRCQRLRRDCLHEETPRRQKEKQSTRIKALEEKVNSLLTLLTPDKNVVGNTNATIITTTPAATEEQSSDNVSSASVANVQSTQNSAPSTVDESREFDAIDSGILTMATADILLETYKQVHTKFFPFVVVDPGTDAATLRRDKPALFLAVVTACLEADHTIQRRLGSELKRIISERVVIRNERSIELLQALLVHLSWIHYHFHPRTNQSYMLLQIAIALVMDLDLDRCPAHRDQRVGSNLCRLNAEGNLPTQCQRTTAETRALLGCFYLCSSMAMARKELLMRHTSWIEHCCHVLSAEQEYPTDVYATAFVNAKYLAQRIGERFSYGDHASIRYQSDAVVQMSLNGFKKETADLEASPGFSSAQENYVLMAELKVLSITMHEVALYRDLTTTAPSSTNIASQLWELLTSTRGFLEYFLSVPKDALRHLPAAFFSFAAYALIVLSTVSRLPSTSGWDGAMARREADAVEMARRVKVKFGDELTRTGAHDSLTPDQKDVWALFTRGMRGLMAWHERCEKESERPPAAVATTTMGGEEETDYELLISESGAQPLTARCAMADVMTPFHTMRLRKPTVHAQPHAGDSLPEGPQHQQQQQHPNADSGGNAFVRGSGGDAQQPTDMVDGFWDDEVWQSIMDEFSMFPTTTAGLPAGPSVQHQVERLR